jgi:flagellar protein FlbD
MIELTKLNGTKLVINSDLIEYIEVLPDSLITLTTGMKIMVKESIPEIIEAVVDFRRRIRHEGYRPTGTAKPASSPDAQEENDGKA